MVNAYDGDHLDFRGAEFTGPFTARAEYREHAPAPSALDALPARAVGFAGRGDELRQLVRALEPAGVEGGPEREALAANGLGIALQESGRRDEAVRVHADNPELFRVLGDLWGEGVASTNLAAALRGAGRAEESMRAHVRACEALREAGDRRGAAQARANLASALRRNGRTDDAIDMFRGTLAVLREFEDLYGEGHALAGMARAFEDAGRPAEACEHWRLAEDAYTRANAPDEAGEARDRAEEISP
ncbi:tetratricopeptide repeat protein [Streptomyces sp. NBC_00696]|uniref:tetratricopeptide repeat protein n=1 Tax=Streptomyces sp. NBC_00696 TaxID=2903672 RepID=UPI002E360325|nr:tetratricopeptide repeat protein [Streptomyces sp. NBC_00696]